METKSLEQLAQRISALKEEAQKLRDIGAQMGLPAVERNARRILATVRVLEITAVEIHLCTSTG